MSEIDVILGSIDTWCPDKKNRDIILKFEKERTALGIMPSARITFLTSIKHFFTTCNKPFNEVAKDDVVEFVSRLKSMKKVKRSQWANIKVQTPEGNIQEFKVKHYRKRFKKAVVVPYYFVEYDLGNEKKYIKGKIISKKQFIVETLLDSPRYSPYSISNFIAQFKVFFKWLNNGKTTDAIEWIKGRRKHETPEWANDILSKEEIKRMIEAGKNSQDRAIIAVLYESGARSGEARAMCVGDLKIDSIGGVIRLRQSKTIRRPLRLIFSLGYLKDWLNDHPLKNDANAPLWVSYSNRMSKYVRMSDVWFSKKVKNIAKFAGIKKRVYPHLFRHSICTHLSSKLNENLLRKMFGWSSDSSTASIYTHLTHEDLDNKLAEVYGVQRTEQKEKDTILQPKHCGNCKDSQNNPTLNEPTSKFCKKCGAVLDLKSALEQEEIKKQKKKADNEMIMQLIKNQEEMVKKIEALEKKGGI